MVKRDPSLQRTSFHCSRVQWGWALHHSSQRLAWRMVILGMCAAARPYKPISWSSQRTVLVLTLLPDSLKLRSECCNRRQTIFSMLCASALGSPIMWACVAYHFVAELLLLDISIRKLYTKISARGRVRWQRVRGNKLPEGHQEDTTSKDMNGQVIPHITLPSIPIFLSSHSILSFSILNIKLPQLPKFPTPDQNSTSELKRKIAIKRDQIF